MRVDWEEAAPLKAGPAIQGVLSRPGLRGFVRTKWGLPVLGAGGRPEVPSAAQRSRCGQGRASRSAPLPSALPVEPPMPPAAPASPERAAGGRGSTARVPSAPPSFCPPGSPPQGFPRPPGGRRWPETPCAPLRHQCSPRSADPEALGDLLALGADPGRASWGPRAGAGTPVKGVRSDRGESLFKLESRRPASLLFM